MARILAAKSCHTGPPLAHFGRIVSVLADLAMRRRAFYITKAYAQAQGQPVGLLTVPGYLFHFFLLLTQSLFIFRMTLDDTSQILGHPRMVTFLMNALLDAAVHGREVLTQMLVRREREWEELQPFGEAGRVGQAELSNVTADFKDSISILTNQCLDVLETRLKTEVNILVRRHE